MLVSSGQKRFASSSDPLIGEQLADEFIAMYVNERTLDYQEEGRESIRLFLNRAHQTGLIPEPPQIEFIR